MITQMLQQGAQTVQAVQGLIQAQASTPAWSAAIPTVEAAASAASTAARTVAETAAHMTAAQTTAPKPPKLPIGLEKAWESAGAKFEKDMLKYRKALERLKKGSQDLE